MFRNGLFSAAIGLSLVTLVASTATAEDAVIKGKVLFDGKPTKPRAVALNADPKCTQMRAGKELLPEALVVSEKGELANVFVSIKNPPADKKWEIPKEPVLLDQVGCQYVPHVFGIMAGQDFNASETFMGRLMHDLLFIPGQPEIFFTTMYVAALLLVLQGLIMYPPRWFRRWGKPAAPAAA